MRILKTFTAVLLILGNLFQAQADGEGDKIYFATRIDKQAPDIDGNFADASWQSINWHNHFIQTAPYEGKMPTQDTRFKILYDNDYLYVALRAYDNNPDSIVRRLSRRDNLEGDQMGLQIDSYNDDRTAFCFFVSAAGVKTDWIITDDGMNNDYNWDPIWYVESRIDSLGWKAEMKIPFEQLRFSKKGDQKWGLQVKRTIYRNDEEVLWNMIPQDAGGWVSEFGSMKGLDDIEPQKERAITPYTVARMERFKEQPDNPFASEGRQGHWDVGVNGKFGITNNLTLDMAINPDFGQVEADPSQVNLTAYETFFEEKRPFFIEGQSIMNFRLMQMGDFMNDNLFYSRRIGRAPHHSPSTEAGEYAHTPDNTSILGALKLTGKTRNGWSLGVMESMTAREQATIKDGSHTQHSTVEPLTNYFLGRAQKDFNQGQTMLGGIFTATNRKIEASHLNYLHDQAYTGGINFKHRWNDRNYMFSFRGIFSHVRGSQDAIIRTQTSSARYFQRPDASHLKLDSSRTSLSGHGASMMLAKFGKGHFRYGLFFNWKSPGLGLNDMGYQRDADQIAQLGWMQYRLWEPFSIFRNMQINLNQWRLWDYSGQHLVSGGNINFHTQFTNYWNLAFNINANTPSFSKSELRGGPMLKEPASVRYWVNLKTDPRKKLSFRLGNSQSWSQYQHAHTRNIWSDISYRPHHNLEITLSPSLNIQHDNMQFVDIKDYGGQKRYLMAQIDRKTFSLSMRLNFSLTPDISLQFWGQPFIASGDYSEFKRITDPDASVYRERFSTFSEEQISPGDNMYRIDEDRNGVIDYTIRNPDFNVLQFKSNLVARWEYSPGSTLYLVWSQNRNGFHPSGRFAFGNDFQDLFSIYPRNVFLVKFTYRLGL